MFNKYRVRFSKSFNSEERNRLALQTERLPPIVLDKYRAKRRSFHIYRAAARLWGQGVDFQKALGIVSEAFHAATHET